MIYVYRCNILRYTITIRRRPIFPITTGVCTLVSRESIALYRAVSAGTAGTNGSQTVRARCNSPPCTLLDAAPGRDKKIAGTRAHKHDTFVPRRVVIQKYREADVRPGFRTLSWEMSSLNTGHSARMIPPLFPPISSSLPLSFRTRSRCRRYSRKLWGNGFELSRGISRSEERERERVVVVVVREDISGYGDFYVPILIHAATTRRIARYFLRATAFRASGTLKSMRAVVPRSPSLSYPLPLHLVLLSLCGRGMIYFERTRIIEGRGTSTRLFDGRYRTLDNVLCSVTRDGALISCVIDGPLVVNCVKGGNIDRNLINPRVRRE